jgi:two-component system sensor histidine kinase UhpB
MTRTSAHRAAPVLRRHPAAGRHARRPTLFRRLFLTYTAVLGLAVVALVIAPVTISVPTKLSELAVILAAFVVMLLAYRTLLHRALAPLEHLTEVMRGIDPLAPGARVTAQASDAEVAALADAFNDMLDRLEGERRDSGRRALSAQEAERRRVARELHDEIGQLLTGLLLRSETLARRAPDDLRPDIEELREAARHAAEEVRVIARRLRPEALDELGLQSALLARCTAIRERAGIEVERHLERDLPLNAEEELVFYRVAQEALTNVVRHSVQRARASRCGPMATVACCWSCEMMGEVCRRTRIVARRGSAACASGRCWSAPASRCGRRSRRGQRSGCTCRQRRRTDDHPACDACVARRRSPDRPARAA